MNRLVRGVVGTGLVAVLATPLVLAGPNPAVPKPNVALSHDHFNLTGNAGDTLTASFTVDNRADCGVSFRQGRTSLKGVTVDCDRWSLVGHQSMTCNITATKATDGRLKDRFLLEARIDEDCKTAPLAQIASREKHELQPMLDEADKLRRNPPSELEYKEREKKLLARFQDAIRSLETQEQALEGEAKAEEEMLQRVWNEAQREQVARIERQVLKLEIIEKDNPAMRALDRTIVDQRGAAQKEIDKVNAERKKTCDSIWELEKLKSSAMADLRAGAWHNLCKKTKTEIEKEFGISLEKHLENEGGEMVPVPYEVIREREAEFDAKIANAKKACSSMRDRETATQKKWVDAIKALEAKRPDIEKKHKESIATTRAELEQLRENSRTSVMRHRERLAAVARKYSSRREELAEKRTKLERETEPERKKARAEFDKLVQEHEAKVRALDDKAQKLRHELMVLAGQIRAASNPSYTYGVLIDATFR